MKTNEILELDCRIKSNEEIVQKVLRQIKPLAKYSEEEIPLEALERCLKELCAKYDFYVKELHADHTAADKFIIWRMIIVKSSSPLKSAVTCHGRNLYEVMSKANIGLYSLTRRLKK